MYKKFIVMTMVVLVCVGAIVATICVLYEKYYIHSSANKKLLESVVHLHDKDPIFFINYYFERIEFTNSTSLGRNEVLEDDDKEKFLVLKKKGLYFDKSKNYNDSRIGSLCLIIEDDVNVREFHKAYVYINKNFKFHYLLCADPYMQRDKKELFDSYLKLY